MRFAFGAAKRDYQANLHPRLLFSADDLPGLRKLTSKGDGKKLFAQLRIKSSLLADIVHNAPDLGHILSEWNYSWERPGTLVMFGLFDIALAGAIAQDARLIEAVRKVFATMPEAAQRSNKPSGFIYGLPTSVPLSYDLLFHELGPEIRKAFAEWAVPGVIRDGLTRYGNSVYHSAGGNIPLSGTTNSLLMNLATAGDEHVPDFTAERAETIRRLEATFHCAIGIDGYPAEDVGYGTAVTAELVIIGEMLRRAGWYDMYKQAPRVKGFGEAMIHFVQPWGDALSNTGDHGDDFRDRQLSLGRLATETRSPALRWLAGVLWYSHGKVHPENTHPEFYREIMLRKGFQIPCDAYSVVALPDLAKPQHPGKCGVPTSFRDRDRGLVSFRSSWRDDATFVVFDGSTRSPAAPGHDHASAGHFSLSALGDYFAIDTGRYCVEQDQHNITLINGKSGRSTNGEWHSLPHGGELVAYEPAKPGKLCDYAAVNAVHQYGNCIWAKRHLGLVNPRDQRVPAWVWTADDLNPNNDWNEHWFAINTSPENKIEIEGNRATITGWRQGNHLDVHFLLPLPSHYSKAHTVEVTQDEQTTSSYKYVPDAHQRVARFPRPAAMVHGPVYVRPRLLGKVAGYNGRFITLMIPRRKGEAPAVVRQLDTTPGTIGGEIRMGKVADTFLFSYETHLLEAGDIQGRGRWAVVRRATGSGKVIAWHADDEATSLIVAGKALRI